MSQIRIATGGKAGAGKDFVLNILTQYHARNGLRQVAIGGFGTLVRLDWKLAHGDEGTRSNWQDWGQLRRQEDEAYWLKAAARWADSLDAAAVVGFSGVRFLNELSYLQDNSFSVGLVRAPKEVRLQRLINRDGYVWSEAKLNHVTETALDQIPDWAWDFVIDNG